MGWRGGLVVGPNIVDLLYLPNIVDLLYLVGRRTCDLMPGFMNSG